MLLRRVAVGDESVQTIPVAIGEAEGNSSAHALDSHASPASQSSIRTLPIRTIH
jgi:hypothetical protein